MLVNNLNVILKAIPYWDRLMVGLSYTLKSIIGSNGIPIAYVIRVADLPKLSRKNE